MQNAETYRLFVAISLPEEVKDEMQRAQTELRRALPENCVRWAKREQFHLTLRFLGNVPVNRTEALVRSLQEACRRFPVLRLRAERIGFFPNLKSPRVIWVGVHDHENFLPELQEAVVTAVKDFTAEKPEGKFTGHVTLGRAKLIKRPQAEILSKLALDMAEKVFGEWTAAKVEIIRSELLPDGARYMTLAGACLSEGRIARGPGPDAS
jgi:2'-5' RNA ligase